MRPWATGPVRRWRRGAALAALAAAGAALLGGGRAAAAPSTFGTIVGNALLCMDEIDNKYLYSYMATLFAPPYKHDGGAYWFKAQANLWGTPVIDIIISDDSNPLVFVGAVIDATPPKLEEAVLAASGMRFRKSDASAFPLRESSPGSRIVYFDKKAKIYCAKYKPLPPSSR